MLTQLNYLALSINMTAILWKIPAPKDEAANSVTVCVRNLLKTHLSEQQIRVVVPFSQQLNWAEYSSRFPPKPTAHCVNQSLIIMSHTLHNSNRGSPLKDPSYTRPSKSYPYSTLDLFLLRSFYDSIKVIVSLTALSNKFGFVQSAGYFSSLCGNQQST